MSDQTHIESAQNSPPLETQEVKAGDIASISTERKAWLKGGLGMALCCAAPLLLIAAIALFGLSLGALASGFLSLGVLLACPVGMFIMIRMMIKNRQ